MCLCVRYEEMRDRVIGDGQLNSPLIKCAKHMEGLNKI
jgi:hypothetical protein